MDNLPPANPAEPFDDPVLNCVCLLYILRCEVRRQAGRPLAAFPDFEQDLRGLLSREIRGLFMIRHSRKPIFRATLSASVRFAQAAHHYIVFAD